MKMKMKIVFLLLTFVAVIKSGYCYDMEYSRDTYQRTNSHDTLDWYHSRTRLDDAGTLTMPRHRDIADSNNISYDTFSLSRRRGVVGSDIISYDTFAQPRRSDIIDSNIISYRTHINNALCGDIAGSNIISYDTLSGYRDVGSDNTSFRYYYGYDNVFGDHCHGR